MHPNNKHCPPVKILQVFNQYLEPGGEETWVNEVTRLSGEHYQVANLRFRSMDWTGNKAPNRLKQAVKVWDNPDSRSMLRKAVEEVAPNVLLFHNVLPVGSLGLYDEAKRIGLPIVQYIHNFRPFSPSGTLWVKGCVQPAALSGNPWHEILGRSWEKSFLKTLLVANYQARFRKKRGLEQIDHWLAVSDFMRHQFISAGIPADRITTLRHCWTPKVAPPPLHASGHYLFLGRLVPEKGTGTLLSAWQHIEQKLGDKAPRLVIAGAGPEETKIRNAAKKLKRVVCVGHVTGEDKDFLLRSSKALIAPSIWWEPLGLIVHEAYDYARPVLAADSGGLSETVIDGQTGFLHQPGNVNELVSHILRMESTEESSLSLMGIEGRHWLEANASPEDWLSKFSNVMSSLTD